MEAGQEALRTNLDYEDMAETGCSPRVRTWVSVLQAEVLGRAQMVGILAAIS